MANRTHFSVETTCINQYSVIWFIPIPRAFVWDPHPSETPFGDMADAAKTGYKHFSCEGNQSSMCLSYEFKSFAGGHHSEDGLGLHITLKRKCQDADHLEAGPSMPVSSSASKKPQRVRAALSRKLVMTETSYESDVWTGCFKVRYLGTVEQHKLQQIKIVIEFGPRSLKGWCESVLSEELGVENVIEYLIFADWIRADSLKQDCLDFIAQDKTITLEKDHFTKILGRFGLTDLDSLFNEAKDYVMQTRSRNFDND